MMLNRDKARAVLLDHALGADLDAVLNDLESCVDISTTDRLGNAAYAAYVATGEDTDGARNWRELFLPMTFPEWSDIVGAAVVRLRMERDLAEEGVHLSEEEAGVLLSWYTRLPIGVTVDDVALANRLHEQLNDLTHK